MQDLGKKRAAFAGSFDLLVPVRVGSSAGDPSCGKIHQTDNGGPKALWAAYYPLSITDYWPTKSSDK